MQKRSDWLWKSNCSQCLLPYQQLMILNVVLYDLKGLFKPRWFCVWRKAAKPFLIHPNSILVHITCPAPFLADYLNVSIDSACSFILASLGFEDTSITSVMYYNCRCYYSCFIKTRSIPWVTARLNLIPCLSHFQSTLSAVTTFCKNLYNYIMQCWAKYILLPFQVYLLQIGCFSLAL